MSASCNFTLKYKGTEEEFKPLWKLLHKIEGKDESASEGIIPLFRREDDNSITTTNAECQKIWGDDFLDPDPAIYLLMAKTAPNLEFEIYTDRCYEGGGEGCYTEDKVIYKDGKLTYKVLAQVDSLTIEQLFERMMYDWDMSEMEEGLLMAAVGKTRIFEDLEALKQDMRDFEYVVVEELSKDVRCVVCGDINDQDEKVQAIIQKAKKLGVPVISEAEYLMRFCEVEASWGGVYEGSELYDALTYEDACKYYKFDETVTEELFNKYKKESYNCLSVTMDKCVSTETPWDVSVYTIDSEGVVRDEQNNVNSYITTAVKKLEKQCKL